MNRVQFDVLSEPWIPVVHQDGKREELGLLNVLHQAHELKEISDASPMVEYGLYRLLTVFLMDAYRPETVEDLEELLENGSFSMDVIAAYLNQCYADGASFDLFDEKRPFMQTPYEETWDGDMKSVNELDCTLPSGNSHIHFDHRGAVGTAMTFAEAARRLIPLQLFCTAGTGGPSGVNGAPPYYVVVARDNLFETLVYNMPAIENLTIPFDSEPVFWRNSMVVVKEAEKTETSWLYGMLFPARRVHLNPNPNTMLVESVYCTKGINYKVTTNWLDPAVAYSITDKGRGSLKPDFARPMWQNMGQLINKPGKEAPLVLRQANLLDPTAVYFKVQIYGVQTNQASYIFAGRQDLQIPAMLMNDQNMIFTVKAIIEVSESIGYSVGKLLSAAGEDVIPSHVVSELLTDYYAACEQKFWACCTQVLPTESDFSDFVEKWKRFAADTLLKKLQQTESQLSLRGKALGDMAITEGKILALFKKMKIDKGERV